MRIPLGRRVKIDAPMRPGAPEQPWLTVVGVVADVRFSPERDPMPTVYRVHAQVPLRRLILVLRTDASPAGVAPAAMAAVRALNRDIVVGAFTLGDRIRQGRTMVGRRFATLLLSALAVIATLMALLGIYAVLAYSVAQRTREIGIRMALGASRAAVVGQVTTLALGMAGIGVAVGMACALAATRTLRTFLFGVSPTDPATLARWRSWWRSPPSRPVRCRRVARRRSTPCGRCGRSRPAHPRERGVRWRRGTSRRSDSRW